MLWIYITIAVSIILVFAVRLTLKSMEHLSQQNCLPTSNQISVIKSITEPVLNEPIRIFEYNRNNIPVDVRNKLSNLLYKRLLLKTNNPILPNGFEFVRIQQDNEKSLWTVEAFINTSGCFQVGKIVWEFWMFPGRSGDGYQLKSVRPYSFHDGNSHLIPKVHGAQKNMVISKDNLTNPFINNMQAGLTSEGKTNLEMTTIAADLQSEIDTRQGRQPWAAIYNRWILPKGIQRYDVFATFTPDIINNNLYRTGKFDDLFSRTRHDPSFPHGTATGGR
jgi:hypothetical protein